MMNMNLGDMFLTVLLLSVAAGIGFSIGIEIKNYLAKVISNLFNLKFK